MLKNTYRNLHKRVSDGLVSILCGGFAYDKLYSIADTQHKSNQFNRMEYKKKIVT